jgi:hypothetical protein
MEPQLRSLERPRSFRPAAPRPLDATQFAVKDLRNRLLVFYSASAWARSRRATLWPDVTPATTELERSAETLRRTLQALITALDPSNDHCDPKEITHEIVPEAARAVGEFLLRTEDAMAALRKGLVLCGIDGRELLADLEDALLHVRDAAFLLAAASCRPSYPAL